MYDYLIVISYDQNMTRLFETLNLFPMCSDIVIANWLVPVPARKQERTGGQNGIE